MESSELGSFEDVATLLAKATPMMRQYLTVKSEHPESIVLFRMGDFFETFYDDAVDCSRLLDLTLTARSKEKDPVPMAGVPHHAVDGYIARLIECGRTVVIVDQVEDPKLARGLVKREVTEILSPGTFLNPEAPPRVANYLAALVLDDDRKKSWGLGVVELSTGDFRATAGEGEDLLVDELLRVGMRELVVPRALEAHPWIVRAKAELTKTSFAWTEDAPKNPAQVLTRVYDDNEVKALESVLPPLAFVAASATVTYLERLLPRAQNERNPFGHLSALRPYQAGGALILDADARRHLELFRSADGTKRGSLLGAIDEAVTSMGGRMLVEWLTYPLTDLAAITARQEAIGAWVAMPSKLDLAREKLRGVADLERLTARVVMGRATPRDLGVLGSTLEMIPEILACAHEAGSSPRPDPALDAPSAPRALRLLELSQVSPCLAVQQAVSRALIDEPPVDLDGEIFKAGYDEELDRLSMLARDGKGMIAAMEAREREATGISSLKIRYNRVFGYYIEITKTHVKSVPSRFLRKQTTANGERYSTDELRDLERDVLSAEDRLRVRTSELFAALVQTVAQSARHLGLLARALAEIDVSLSLAFVADRRGWARPVIENGAGLDIVGGRHPVLEALAVELNERFVPNDVTLTAERSLMIITGPNMAGKSTIMRQTALIAVLAHVGSFVPVQSARIGLLDRIFTRVGASDDLSRGRSTFMVEMTETARILRSATSRSLILLDEIGRGTSTFDGLSIAWAVAEHIHDTVLAKTMFATHYHELTEICRDKPRAFNVHVAVRDVKDQIVFLRKLVPGPTNRSYGVQVARLAGLPKRVVDRARNVLEELEAQGLRAREAAAANGQLMLFRPAIRASTPEPVAPVAAESPSHPAQDALLDLLDAINIDDVTPRQALDRLAELKTLAERRKR